ncbi:MAG TPA: NAD(P)-binding protein, partial [Solirubrobacteraceae bacterium]|nr:NAD(P)-binding protein [Solirubrobacteraceae bacterium]
MSTNRLIERPLAPPRPLVRRTRLAGAWWRRHFAFPLWLVTGVLAIGLGTWGFTQLRSPPGSTPIHHLNVFQSIVAAVNLFGLSLGSGASLGERLNWPLMIALVLAASLTVRALIALTRKRLRRWYVANRLRGHVLIAGAGAIGTRLADELADAHDVVLIELDERSPSLAADRNRFVWAVQGDATQAAALRSAGIGRAAELYAVTADDYVNSQVVTAAQSVDLRVRVHVRVEDPGLTRFFEEGPGESPDAPTARVLPFSTNAVAARALLLDAEPIGDWKSQPGPLLSHADGAAPHLLLVGDHPFLEAVTLEALHRWRSLALAAGDELPPLRLSVYGPAAVERVERLRNRWRPEPELVEIYARDLPEGGPGAIEADEWLRRLRGGRGERRRHGPGLASHALVACEAELDGVALALAVGRAIGERIPLLRVSLLGSGELDERIHERTRASRNRATTSITSIPELVCAAAAIREHSSAEDRLVDELVRGGATLDSARRAVARLFDGDALDIHSDPAWRFSAREVPMLRALLDERGVALEAFVAAGLALDLGAPATLERCAERLLGDDGSPGLAGAWRTRLAPSELRAAAFAACCEYARATHDPDALRALRERVGDDAAARMLELREFVLLPAAAARAKQEGRDPGELERRLAERPS